MVFQIILTGVAGAVKIKGIIGGNVTLPCIFREAPLNQIRVTWQTSPDVLMSLNRGVVEYDHVSSRFIGRTHFFQASMQSGNFSLLLTGVVARDEQDLFKCYVQVNDHTGFSVKHSSEATLEVAGSFSQPLLEGPGKKFYACDEPINFTCTSKGGYPEPQVKWTVNKKIFHPKTSVALAPDLVTNLYNVSSALTINASAVQILQCSVVNTRIPETRDSVLLTFPNCTPSPTVSPSEEESALWKIALGVLGTFLLLAAMTIAIFIQKSRQSPSNDPANEITVSLAAPANGSTLSRDIEFPLLLRNLPETSNNTNPSEPSVQV
ncbi:ICOS ligand-like isoform X2 [Rhinatrema bivittatum]|nr:ICOS ligand-like isoform X2 [Rhinatrema bivittatum]